MSLSTIPISILVVILIRISWIDWRTQEIPDGLVLAGLYLGPFLVFPAYFFAFVLAGGYSVLLLATRRAGRGDYLAFGPFLSAGVLGAFFFGELFLGMIL